jgi:hypothetical protein
VPGGLTGGLPSISTNGASRSSEGVHRRLNLHDGPTSAGPSRGSPGLRPDYQRRPVSACLFGWCALEAFRMLLKCTVREVHLHGRPFSSDQLFERGSVWDCLGVILRRTWNRSVKDQRGLPRRHAEFTAGRRQSCIAFVSVSHAPHAWTLSTPLQTCASDCTPPCADGGAATTVTWTDASRVFHSWRWRIRPGTVGHPDAAAVRIAESR